MVPESAPGQPGGVDPLSAVAALTDPSRRAVYEFVLAADGPVSRDDVASALGMVRGTAAFHLDRLAKEELLSVSYRRLSGRSGPGSGRPTKLYAPSAGEISVSLPERRYDLAGELLAAAIEDSLRAGVPVGESLKRVAADAGRRMAESAAAVRGSGVAGLGPILDQYGYEPAVEDDGSIVLRNCPFHRLARKHTDVVCGLNLELLSAVVDGCDAGEGDDSGVGRREDDGGDGRRRAVLDPAPGRCCVRIKAAG